MIDMREAWDGNKEARMDHWREISMHGMMGPCMYKQCLPSLTCMKTISTWHVHNLAGLFMVHHKRIIFEAGGVCSIAKLDRLRGKKRSVQRQRSK